MSVVVVICASCESYGVCKSFFVKLLIFFQKEFLGELIVFRHLNMDFTIFFNVIVSDLSKLSLTLEFQDNNITVR